MCPGHIPHTTFTMSKFENMHVLMLEFYALSDRIIRFKITLDGKK